MDFGAQAGAWVDAFMRNINWEAVYSKYQTAMHAWKAAGLLLADKSI
jgi:Fe-Mn family superoxide dismutase